MFGAAEAKASAEYGKAMAEIQDHMGTTPVGKIDDIVDNYISAAIAKEQIVKDASGKLAIASGENAMSKPEFEALKQLDNARVGKSPKISTDLAPDEVTQEIPDWIKPGKEDGISIQRVSPDSDYKYAAMTKDGKVVGFRTYNLPEKGKVGVTGSDTVYVDPSYRRQGIATKLTEAVKNDGFTNFDQYIKEAPHTAEGAAFTQSLLNKKELTAAELNTLKRTLGGAVKDWTPGTPGHDAWQDLKGRILNSLQEQGKDDVAQQFNRMGADYSSTKALLGQVRKITKLGPDFLENPLGKNMSINSNVISSSLDNLSSAEAILKMDFNPAHIDQLTTTMKALDKISDYRAVNRVVTNRNSFTKNLSSIAAKREENLSQGLDEFALLNPDEQKTLKVVQTHIQDTGKLLDEYRVASNIKGMPKVLNDALKNPKDADTVRAAIDLAKANFPKDGKAFATYRDALDTQRKRFIALGGKPGKKQFQTIMKIMDDPETDSTLKQEVAYMTFGEQGDKFVNAINDGKAYDALLRMEKMTGGDQSKTILPSAITQAFEGNLNRITTVGSLFSHHPMAVVVKQFLDALAHPQKASYLAQTGIFAESEIKAMQAYYNLAKFTLKANQVTPVIGNAIANHGNQNGQ
jgi:GNAT superfamily N-acetyltransferase